MQKKSGSKKIGLIYTAPKKNYKRFHKFIANHSPRSEFSITSVGNYALKSLDFGRLTTAELEASKKFIKRVIKKRGKLYNRTYTYLPLTKKPGETRMGKGKSSRVSDWVCPIRAGKIIFELGGVSEGLAMQVFSRVREKLSLSTKIVQLRR